jgi:hypothetical protein
MSSNFRLYYVLSFFRRAHSLKLMRYDYDLISGKVNEVQYQPGKPDAFYHRYHYDAENRLTAVQTSRDRVYWESDATYRYYAHGPLQRTVLGQQQVQGIDYAYTLQGWLKGVNSTSLQPDHDMGGDGRSSGGILSPVARDVAGFALHYHHGDYQPIGAGAAPFAAAASGLSELFNGNISAMSVHIGAFQPLHYRYRYDQLNRIKSLHSFTGLNLQGNHWNQAQLSGDYSEDVVYDPNGNIATYQRKGNAGLMDHLTYHYYYTNTQGQRSTYKLGAMPGDIRQLSNQLAQVTDLVTENVYSTDIDDQSQSDNYRYDPIGNLIADQREGISEIEWSVYGKIKKITKNNALITYGYDAAGNRIFKQINGEATTLYVRDASGNVMSVYEGANASSLKQTEVHLYGSSRLGIAGGAPQIPELLTLAGDFTAAKVVEVKRGEKFFEWSNHLGNVLATVSDRKIAHSSNSSMIDYYTADVISAQDYYPFGMIMPGREYLANSSSSYRYSINGQEKTTEIAPNTTTAEFWQYDARIVRRWNIDPKPNISISPYNCFAGNPIFHTDPLGDTTLYYSMKGNFLGGVYNDGAVSRVKVNEKMWKKVGGQLASKMGVQKGFRNLKQRNDYVSAINSELDNLESTGKFGDLISRETGVQNLTFTGSYNDKTHLASGTLSLNSLFDDGSSLSINQWEALSGTVAKGGKVLYPLPNRNDYIGTGIEPRSAKGFVNHGVGYVLMINDFPVSSIWNRGLFRIHPDGNSPGSAGCIALQSGKDGLLLFKSLMQGYTSAHGNINIQVNIASNPNIGYIKENEKGQKKVNFGE